MSYWTSLETMTESLKPSWNWVRWSCRNANSRDEHLCHCQVLL